MQTFQLKNRTIQIYDEGTTGDVLILLHDEFDKGQEILEECKRLGVAGFTLACISGISWNDDLSPWPAPATFKKAPDFGGKADEYREELLYETLPAILGRLTKQPEHMILAGYSLAGLFALYTVYHTDCFDGVISASGSLWYLGFLEYVKTHPISKKVKRVYFSVGDKEAKTRNAVMQPVEENTREIALWLNQCGVDTTFELNEGGHFKEDALRLAKGIRHNL